VARQLGDGQAVIAGSARIHRAELPAQRPVSGDVDYDLDPRRVSP
jgi:hypothetical protein